jgi:uncharacterized lipoprotein YajG
MTTQKNTTIHSSCRFLLRVAVTTIAVLAVGSGFVSGCSSPPASVTNSDTNASMSQNFLRQKAMESSGDFNRLSPEDQQQVQKLTNGKGVAEIQKLYQQK